MSRGGIIGRARLEGYREARLGFGRIDNVMWKQTGA